MSANTASPVESESESRLALRYVLAIAGIVACLALWWNWQRQADRKARRLNVQTILNASGKVSYDFPMKPEFADIIGDIFPVDATHLDIYGGAHDAVPIGTVDLERIDVDRETMLAIANLPSFRRLCIDNAKFTDEAWETLLDIENVESIELGGYDCTAERLAELDRLGHLKELSIRSTEVTSKVCRAIAGIRGLEQLDFGSVIFSDHGLSELSKLTELKEFRLSPADGSVIGDEDYQFLASLVALEDLDLSRSPITDEGLKYVANLSGLQSLGLDSVSISNEGLKYIADLPQLQTLSLNDNDIDNEGLLLIAKLSTLKILFLGRTRITGDVPNGFERLTNLESLQLSRSSINDAGIGHLHSLKKLRNVLLYGTEVTDHAKALLQQALPKLNIECESNPFRIHKSK